MTSSLSNTSAFSVYDMLGIGSALCPKYIQERFLNHIAQHIAVRHPSLMGRLQEANGKTYAFNISGMPYVQTLKISGKIPRIRLHKKTSKPSADVRLTASLEAFISMLEGRSDGDTMFFSRELMVEGDTEALLVLRNSIECEDISLASEVFSIFGKYEGQARQAFGVGSAVIQGAGKVIERIEGRLPPQVGQVRKKLGKYIERRITGG